MTATEYASIEGYMKTCMQDAAHDTEHIYRVLYAAMHIADTVSEKVDRDVLICACLLHDIGRKRQFENPALCHAEAGGEMAYAYLKDLGKPEEFAGHVRDCIQSHRFRGDNRPRTIEAKILFDADKLDVSGALGVARSLVYQGQVQTPLYAVAGSEIDLGLDKAAPDSFFKEYHFKLRRLYDGFYTEEAGRMAGARQKAAEAFFEALKEEVSEIHRYKRCLEDAVSD